MIIKYVQDEYKYWSDVIESYSKHIEKCFAENIFNNTERVKYLDILDKIIMEMNDIYDKDIIQESDEKKLVDFTGENGEDIANILKMYKSNNINIVNNVDIDIFNNISDRLLILSLEIGFENLDVSFKLLYGKSFNIREYVDPMYDVINKCFIPVSYKKEKYFNDKKKKILISQMNNKNDVLLDNFYKIEINIQSKKTCVVYEGYFLNNLMDIIKHTSHICYPVLHEKKNMFMKCKSVNNMFLVSYIDNMGFGEFLSTTYGTFDKKIYEIWEKYNRLSKLSFKNIMAEFVSEKISLMEQYDIIKLLLIGGTIDNINTAGLLYGLTKDKKYGSKFLSEIIYKNLGLKLRTHLRTFSVNIKIEMDKLKTVSADNMDIKKIIASKTNMPINIKKIVLDKYEEMRNGNGTDYYKQKTFIDILMNYPWKTENDNAYLFSDLLGNENKSKILINNVKSILDEKVYGHQDCKNTMQELIGKWISNPKSIGKSIGLHGPPGIGKTLIAKALGEALGLPFTQINLGGMDDRSILSGHSYTYNSAQPGLIIRKLVEAGDSRCIIYFDELDKTTTRNGINEIHNILMHVTDPNTNTQYSDAFFGEITFNLEKVLFVFSYNDPEKIDDILLDRMEKIEVKPYTLEDKKIIFKNYLVKEVSDDINIGNNFVKFSDESIEYLIENYTSEAGVRELKRKIEAIYSKINLDRIFGRNLFSSLIKPEYIEMSTEIINGYLEKPNLNIKQIHTDDEIGVVNGLYATSGGSGGIIPILVYNNHIGNKQKFKLHFTGSQGKIMKESVSFAFIIATNLIKKKYIDIFSQRFPYGLHIHTPDASTPKDGPSAGCAFTTAFISRILGFKVKRYIAMTGEIELNGKITAIGGLTYKLKGAQKAGVKIIFIPRENKDDLQKIISKDRNIEKNMEIHLVDHIYDILKMVFICDNIEDYLN